MRPQTDSLFDTIAALATPLGRSALALIRVSGPETLPVLTAVAADLPDDPPVRHPLLTAFIDASGEVIDRGLVTFFRAPASSTGEDVGELSIHGSPLVAKRLLSLLSQPGRRGPPAGRVSA